MWNPPSSVVFKAFLLARILSGLNNIIADCDETFNYWEPMHYLMHGYGFQTWEYSPQFGLRSYAFVYIYAVIGWVTEGGLFKFLNEYHLPHLYGVGGEEGVQMRLMTKVDTFIVVRLVIGFAFAWIEAYCFYESLKVRFGTPSRFNTASYICWLYIFFSAFAPGMFFAGTAFLPSSFCLYMCLLTYGSLFQSDTFGPSCGGDFYRASAIVSVAVSVLLGWPFAAVLGLPVIVSVLLSQRRIFLFFKWSILSLVCILLPSMAIDYHYYGKIVIPAVEIAIYNVFSSKGPELYGVEPLSYYFKNGFLNFNIVFIAALLVGPILLVTYGICWAYDFVALGRQKTKSKTPKTSYKICDEFVAVCAGSSLFSLINSTLFPMYLWFAIFFSQPHKEERFLFPVYPLIILNAAVSVNAVLFLIQRCDLLISPFLRRVKSSSQWILLAAFILGFMTLSMSRIVAVCTNYGAPLNVYRQFYEHEIVKGELNRTVCIGKEWHRFGTHFLLPKGYRAQFIKSAFDGQLPAQYNEEYGTSIAPSYFNDNNNMEPSIYVDISDCDFIVDLDKESSKDALEPSYASMKNEWRVVTKLPFLDAENSNHPIAKSFFIPYVSAKHLKYLDYVILARNQKLEVKT
eukprot:Nk52_evm43s226 gene=Nk52_evmTU43s226